MMNKKMRLRVVISGRVQGVFFRDWTREGAQQRGVTGWVRNRDDGCVEALFEGEEEAVRSLLAALHEGPSSAYVEEVVSDEGEFQGEFSHFSIHW